MRADGESRRSECGLVRSDVECYGPEDYCAILKCHRAGQATSESGCNSGCKGNRLTLNRGIQGRGERALRRRFDDEANRFRAFHIAGFIGAVESNGVAAG